MELLLVARKEDWLPRYLCDRVLELYLQDNIQARELQSDGSYVHCTPDRNAPWNTQQSLLDQASGVTSRNLRLTDTTVTARA